VQGWLAHPVVAPARPYLADPVLRQLYWNNLLAARTHPQGRYLEWRCEAIRRAVKQVIDSLQVQPA
jgi:hypothetical protein